MSAPKPHIKPKADPCRHRTEHPSRDAPLRGEYDPPVFTEGDIETEQKRNEQVLFHEDDCLR